VSIEPNTAPGPHIRVIVEVDGRSMIYDWPTGDATPRLVGDTLYGPALGFEVYAGPRWIRYVKMRHSFAPMLAAFQDRRAEEMGECSGGIGPDVDSEEEYSEEEEEEEQDENG
jgi:hypothetical protein